MAPEAVLDELDLELLRAAGAVWDVGNERENLAHLLAERAAAVARLPKLPAPEPEPEENVDPLRDAREVVSAEAAVTGVGSFVTVRDVLHGAVTGPCRLGKRASLTWRERPRISNRYLYCWGFKCPRCAPAEVINGIRRCLEAWEGDLDRVHRLELAEGEWERRRFSLAELYPKRFMRARRAVDGGMVVFTPGPIDDSELVPLGQLGRRLAEAILDAPVTGRRFSWPTRTSEGEAVAPRPRDPGAERPKRANLPKDVRPEDACALYDEALGRPLGWEDSGPEANECWRKWDAEDLSSEEVDLVREAVQEPLARRTLDEREYARTAARIMARLNGDDDA